MKKASNIAYYFGLVGEYCVMLVYLLKLHQIIRHRYKTQIGEIDIICKRNNTIIFIEVKSRSYDYDQVICSTKQQKRMVRAAENFLFRHPQYTNYEIRFDLVLVRPYLWPCVLKNFIAH